MQPLTKLAAIFIACVTGLSTPAAAGTAFTYQGELSQGGELADGSFNVGFSLWDAAIGGTRIGVEVMFNGLIVSDGRFTVELDFGPEAFDNTDRWLEISVDGNELSPRQSFTRAPYALQTRGIFVDESENVGIGTTSPQRALHVSGDHSALQLQDDNDPQSYSLLEDTSATQMKIIKFSDVGAAVIDVNPVPLDGISSSDVRFFRNTDTAGLKKVQFLRGNNSTEASASIGVDGRHSFFAVHGGRVGIGTDSPIYKLHVETQTGLALYAASATNSGISAFGGANFNAVAVSGITYVEGRTGIYGQSGYAKSGFGIGVRGDCSTPTGFDFWAGGAGQNYGAESSRRWKSNVEPIEDALNKVAGLRGVYFDWDDAHGGHHDIGMIAEEVGQVIPEIVGYEDNGIDARGMDYSKLTPLLVEAVNALRAENDVLRKRLDSIERRHLAMTSTGESK